MPALYRWQRVGAIGVGICLGILVELGVRHVLNGTLHLVQRSLVGESLVGFVGSVQDLKISAYPRTWFRRVESVDRRQACVEIGLSRIDVAAGWKSCWD